MRTWLRSYPEHRSYVVVFVFVWCILVDGFREREHGLDGWIEGFVWLVSPGLNPVL